MEKLKALLTNKRILSFALILGLLIPAVSVAAYLIVFKPVDTTQVLVVDTEESAITEAPEITEPPITQPPPTEPPVEPPVEPPIEPPVPKPCVYSGGVTDGQPCPVSPPNNYTSSSAPCKDIVTEETVPCPNYSSVTQIRTMTVPTKPYVGWQVSCSYVYDLGSKIYMKFVYDVGLVYDKQSGNCSI